MKKLGLVCISTLAACTIMGVSEVQSTNGTNYVVAATTHQGKFSNKNYAEMVFLKFTKQKISDVQAGSLKVTKKGGQYKVADNQNEFKVKVAKHNVTIIDNKGKKHSYTKKSLAKLFKNQTDKLNDLVANNNSSAAAASDTASSQATSQSQSSSNDTQEQPANSSQDSSSENDSATQESTDEHGDVHHITLSGQHDDEGRAIGMDEVTCTDGITRTFEYTEPDGSDN